MATKFPVLPAALLALTSTASAITIEPDAFADGTDLSTAFPGVTLSTVYSDGTVASPSVFSRVSAEASTGTRVFGRTDAPIFHSGTLTWGSSFFEFLRIDITGGATSASIDFIANADSSKGEDDRNPVLAAYDAAGNLVASDTMTGPFADGTVVTLMVSDPNIATIAALGDPNFSIATLGGLTPTPSDPPIFGGPDSWLLDNFQYSPTTPVPDEGSTLPLVLLGFVGLAGFASRLKRRHA